MTYHGKTTFEILVLRDLKEIQKTQNAHAKVHAELFSRQNHVASRLTVIETKMEAEEKAKDATLKKRIFALAIIVGAVKLLDFAADMIFKGVSN